MSDKRIRIILDSKQAERNAKDLDKAVTGVGKSADGVNFAMKSLGVAIGAAIAVQKVIAYADAWTNVQNQLTRVTEGQQDLVNTSNDLLKVSNETRSSLEVTADLYTSLRISTQTLNLSQEKTVDITKTINNLFLESGKSAAETAGAVRQLGQALQSGTLRGDEFNSIAEGAPGILRAIQKETGRTAAELRKLAEQGGITSELIVRSLENYSETAQKAADKTKTTVEQSFVVAKNNILAFVGAVDSASGATNGFAESVVTLTSKLGDPKFLEGTKRYVSLFSSVVSVGAKNAGADIQLFGNLLKAAFTDSTFGDALELRRKQMLDLAEAAVDARLKFEGSTPLSRPRTGLKSTPKESSGPKTEIIDPEEIKRRAKEAAKAQKDSYDIMLDNQRQFYDAIDAEAKQNASAEIEIASAKQITQSMQLELAERLQAARFFRETSLNDEIGFYENLRAVQLNNESIEKANIEKKFQEDQQRRNEQFLRTIENDNLSQETKILLRAEYDNQEILLARNKEEQKTLIVEEGKKARDELDQAESQARLANAGALGNALISLGQGQSKKVFKIGQTLALAQAATALPSAVLQSYQNGGGYPWGLVPAAAMLAVGLKNIQNIRNAGSGLGGGGGGGSAGASIGGGGGGSSVPLSSSPQEAMQQKKIYDFKNVKLDDKISIASMKEFLEADDAIVLIENARTDAQRRNVIGVTAR